ncbi:MAG: ABC-2 family transporter protein [Patescibacteria group bacterium]|jgi:ABC-2 type transport system permease protein
MFKKYLTIAKNKTQAEFVKRANVFAYIGGNLLDLFIQVVIWSAIFSAADVVQGYTKSEMMTYVVIGWIFMYLSTNYGYENVIKVDIYDGRLSNFLIKPVSYLVYITSHSIGRLLFAFSIIIVQAVFFLYFFRADLLYALSPAGLAIFILMFFLAYFIKFFLAVIFGFFSFWLSDINGAYYTLNVLNRFLSGAFFPIAFLPAIVAKLSYFFPFAYTYFLPMQFYLGKITLGQGMQILGAQLVWILVLFAVIKAVWALGLKKFEGTGI